MPLSGLNQTYKNIRRFQTILNVLFKNGFGHLIERLNLQHLITAGQRVIGLKRYPPLEADRISMPIRARMVFEELGPTFIKLGQLLSLRTDLIPEEFAAEFRKLQDRVPPVPFSEIKEQIESELKVPLESVFSYVEPIPYGSASIAQVHEAILPDGRQVMLKVQRPKITEIIETDISILFHLAYLLDRYVPESKVYSPSDIVDEFSRSIKRELDFTIEAGNTQRFANNFAKDRHVVIPKVYWELTTKKVLVLQRLSGVRIDQIETLKARGWSTSKIAVLGSKIFLKQILEYGFFHGDPHPGNLLVVDEDVLALIDFGIVGRMDRELKESCSIIFFSLLNKDYERLVQEYIKVGFTSPDTNIRHFRQDLTELLDTYLDRPMKLLNIGEIITHTIEISLRHHIKTPKDIILLGKTLLFIESIGTELDPNISLLAISRPYARRLISRRFHPRRLFNEVRTSLLDISDLIRPLPRQLRTLIQKLIDGKLEIEFVHLGLENLIHEIDRSSNRISFGLIISSLIIGSSIVMHTQIGPAILGLPAIGIAGYLSAAVMGIWLVISILRSGKL
ncbi:MAG: AarF/ABC1/UbiB kinase family protein [bacterium]